MVETSNNLEDELVKEEKESASADNSALKEMVDDVLPPDVPRDIVDNLKGLITRYLGCFKLRPSEVDKLPDMYADVNEEEATCLSELASGNWKLFIVAETYILDYLFRKEVMQKRPHPLYYLPHIVKGVSNISTLIDASAAVKDKEQQDAIVAVALGLFTRLLFFMMEMLEKLKEYKLIDPSLADKAYGDLNLILASLIG